MSTAETRVQASDIDDALAQINAAYEATIRTHLAGTDAVSWCEIDLSEPFFGLEWGVSEWNTQRQKWRWLGPRGQSHLFLKVPADTDHLVRVQIHTAASGQVLDGLTAFVNETRCTHQGHDWGADGALSHWCIVERDAVAKRQGTAKISWRVLPTDQAPRPGLNNQNAPDNPARLIAFSRINCEPHPLAVSRHLGKAVTEPYTLEPPSETASRYRRLAYRIRRMLNLD